MGRLKDMILRGGENIYSIEVESVLNFHPKMIDFCRRHIADYKIPARVVFLDELPRNPEGKVVKNRLREMG